MPDETRRHANRLPLVHAAWSGVVLVGVAGVIAAELAAPCPAAGPIGFGSCDRVRPLAVATLAVAALIYVGALTGVLVWVAGLVRRGAADPAAARDWYVVAGGVGLVAAPLLAFTLVSAFR